MTKKTRILELFNLGFTSIEIAKKLRCAKSTVSYHCSKIIKQNNKYEATKWRHAL